MDRPEIKLPSGKAGEPFTEAHWNAIVEVVRVLKSIGDGPITRKPWIWLKLTSVSSGSYAWTRVVRDASGWADTAESGTTSSDPAKSANSAVSISTFPTYVQARREPSGELIFDAIPGGAGNTVLRVKAHSAGIAARSGATPGSAVCTLCTWNGTTWTSTGASITVKNDYSTAVGASKLIWVVDWAGDYFVMTEEC
jgi:hypothetical protein